jgi:LytS/YehU family sensor histidine kinase
VPINDEIAVLKSYIELETIRLEDDLQLEFRNNIPEGVPYQVAPLLLIVFIENAFKHAKFVQSAPVCIQIETLLEEDWLLLKIRNNYNKEKQSSGSGIGLTNVKRRLEVLYPGQHNLTIIKDEEWYTVYLHIKLVQTI